MGKAKSGAKAQSRNDGRANGKAAKQNPGSKVKGSKKAHLDAGTLLLLGKGPMTRKGSIYNGPSDGKKRPKAATTD